MPLTCLRKPLYFPNRRSTLWKAGIHPGQPAIVPDDRSTVGIARQTARKRLSAPGREYPPQEGSICPRKGVSIPGKEHLSQEGMSVPGREYLPRIGKRRREKQFYAAASDSRSLRRKMHVEIGLAVTASFPDSQNRQRRVLPATAPRAARITTARAARPVSSRLPECNCRRFSPRDPTGSGPAERSPRCR